MFWVLAARLTNAAAVGRSAAAISAIALLSYLTSLGLPYGILRFGSSDATLSSSLNSALALTITSSVVASLIFVAGLDLWAPALTGLLRSPVRLPIFVLANIGAALVVLLDNLFAARRAAQIALSRSIATAALKLGSLPLLTGLGAIGIYAAGVVPATAVVLIVLAALPRLIPAFRAFRFGPRDQTSGLLRFSLATYPAALLGGAPPFFMPLIALAIVGVRGAAYVYVAWNLLAVSLFIPATVANMSLSEGARALPWRTADQARIFTLSLIMPLVVALVIFAPLVLSLFGHAYASAGANALRIFAVSLIPWTFLSINQAALRVDSRHRELTLISSLFAITTLLIPVLLGLRWGLDGLAAGWTVGVVITSAALSALTSTHRHAERARPPRDVGPPAGA